MTDIYKTLAEACSHAKPGDVIYITSAGCKISNGPPEIVLKSTLPTPEYEESRESAKPMPPSEEPFDSAKWYVKPEDEKNIAWASEKQLAEQLAYTLKVHFQHLHNYSFTG